MTYSPKALWILVCLLGLLPGCNRDDAPPIRGDDGNSDTKPAVNPAPGPPAGILHLEFLDISPGNCIVLTTPGGKNVLIDAGPPGTENDIFEQLQAKGIKRYDYVIATCPTSDHIGSLPALLASGDFGEVLTPGIASADEKRLEQTVSEHHAKLKTVRAGDTLDLDHNVRLEVLGPVAHFDQPSGAGKDWFDNHSLVFRVIFNRASFLFTGDMGANERDGFYSTNIDMHAAVVCGMHHGDRKVVDLNLIHNIHPTWAILDCRQDNTAGYPHAEALDALHTAMVNYYRTDLEGAISIRCDAAGTLTLIAARTPLEEERLLSGEQLKKHNHSNSNVNFNAPKDDPRPVEVSPFN